MDHTNQHTNSHIHVVEPLFPHKQTTLRRFASKLNKLSPQLKVLLPAFLIGLVMLPLTLRYVSKPTKTGSKASEGNSIGQGNRYYLSPTGTNNATCDVTQPCNSLETAFALPDLGNQPGDTIILLDGVYSGQQKATDKHFANPVTVQAASPYKAILQNNGNVLTLRNAYNIHFKDLELKQVEPVPICDTGSPSAYIIQLSDGANPSGSFGTKRGPDAVYYDSAGKLHPNGTDYSGEITFENNIIHDSFCEDHIKLQNGGNINIIGNMFYNQATRNNTAGTTANNGTPEEFIDVNSVFNVKISQNVFFNQFTNPGSPGAFIVVKDSSMGVPDGNTRYGLTDQTGAIVKTHPNNNVYAVNPSNTDPGTRLNTCNPSGANCDTVIGSNNISIDRNIFFNFSNTQREFPWLQFGAEDTLAYVLNHGLVENNLFIGNGSSITRAVFELEGVNGFVFRNNTITGNLPSKHFGYRIKSQTFAQKYPNTELLLANNIWADQTGTMGVEDGTVPFFANADSTTITQHRQLTRNLYWNNGQPIPATLNLLAQYTEDTAPIVTNPGLPNPADLITPVWNGSSFRAISSGGTAYSSIADVFKDLVVRFGTPVSGIADTADPSTASSIDILGNTRGARPDVGAVEILGDPAPTPIPTPLPSPIPTPPQVPPPSPIPSNPPTQSGAIRINFQPAGGEIPNGYIADFGERFGTRNGFKYGWSYNIQSATRKRETTESLLRNTLIHLQLDGNYKWEIEVPNRTYQVAIMAGDPSYTDSLNTLRIENMIVTDDGRDNFDYYTLSVPVTDGRLTIRTAPESQNAKLNYIIITPE